MRGLYLYYTADRATANQQACHIEHRDPMPDALLLVTNEKTNAKNLLNSVKITSELLKNSQFLARDALHFDFIADFCHTMKDTSYPYVGTVLYTLCDIYRGGKSGKDFAFDKNADCRCPKLKLHRKNKSFVCQILLLYVLWNLQINRTNDDKSLVQPYFLRQAEQHGYLCIVIRLIKLPTF